MYVNIQASDDTYRIFGDGAIPILTAEMEQGQSKTVSANNASIKAIQDMLAQPTVLLREGQYHHHAFDFHFETAHVLSIPVDLELRDGFMPAIKPLKARHAGIADTEFGSFHIQCRYTNTAMD